jgi:hypothetical protein
MPNPPYSKEALRSKVIGTVYAEAIINSRTITGLPVDLNETTIAAMKTWRCEPAQKDGKPVPTIVAFQTTFRMY